MGGRDEDEEDEKVRRILAIIAVLSAVIITATYILTKPPVQSYSVSGIAVESEIPLSDFQDRIYIALYNTTKSDAELTCKFELSAISIGEPRGYRIRIEQGKTGIYLGKTEALISGETEPEILNACHAFACLRENITCPQDFPSMRWMVEDAGSVGVVLDSSAGAEAGRGYAEIMGALSFMQSSIIDKNHDGTLDQSEINNNTFFIYPFLKVNDTCVMQPLHTLVENLTGNLSRDCNLDDAIYLLHSDDNNSITIQDSRIILWGDDRRLHSAAIIVRDTLAPDWILRIYNLQ